METHKKQPTNRLTLQQMGFVEHLKNELEAAEDHGVLVVGEGGTGRRKVFEACFRDLSKWDDASMQDTESNKLSAVLIPIMPHYDLLGAMVTVLYFLSRGLIRWLCETDTEPSNWKRRFSERIDEFRNECAEDDPRCRQFTELCSIVFHCQADMGSSGKWIHGWNVNTTENPSLANGAMETARKVGSAAIKGGMTLFEPTSALLFRIQEAFASKEEKQRSSIEKENGGKSPYQEYTLSQAEFDLFRLSEMLPDLFQSSPSYLSIVLHLEKYPVTKAQQILGVMRECLRGPIKSHPSGRLVVSGSFSLLNAWLHGEEGADDADDLIRPAFGRILPAPVPLPHELTTYIQQQSGKQDSEIPWYQLAAFFCGGRYSYALTQYKRYHRMQEEQDQGVDRKPLIEVWVSALCELFFRFTGRVSAPDGYCFDSLMPRVGTEALYLPYEDIHIRRIFFYEFMAELHQHNGLLRFPDIENYRFFRCQQARGHGENPWGLFWQLLSKGQEVRIGGDEFSRLLIVVGDQLLMPQFHSTLLMPTISRNNEVRSIRNYSGDPK
uniref:Uncharacterized protein n=1 Tax=Candidatus Kentrum sp. TC TaxID=2126339 RepID=A0A450YQG0_9GAMM|nr:MAG: hypothetical protein BECKTC1821D_GA0114238_101825 [Candidatus Kentron sp. TC]